MLVEVLHQLVGRDHPPGMVHEVAQAAVFERGELHRHVIDCDPHLARVERDGTDSRSGDGAAGGAAQQGTHAREQLLHRERLGEVVVGPGVDALDPFRPGAARGEDQHREIAACPRAIF